jgi:hypothetical protein
MIPAPFKVVLDANVLYPFSLRDTLLRAASEGLFQLYWSDQILEEARRSLVSSGRMIDQQAGGHVAPHRTSAAPRVPNAGGRHLASPPDVSPAISRA